MTYPYVQAWFDYGVRKGPALGLMYHMAEGGGTVGFLDNQGKPPDRGVSVHAVCRYDGVVVQMLDWTHASGSLNPADRSVDTGYYGHTALVDVLGDWWTNPNSVTLSMEIEGHAVDGPNPAQVKGAIGWGLDMKTRFATLRGALGHTDQTDTKPCPGLTAAMKAIFTGVGGHGLWEVDMGEYVVPFGQQLPFVINGTAKSYAASAPYPALSDLSGTVPVDATVTVVQSAVPHGPFMRVVTGTTGRRLVAAAAGVLGLAAAPPPDCSDEIAAQREKDRAASVAAIEGVFA